MDEQTYRAQPGITASIIKAGARSMLHARHAATVRTDATPAMRWGSLVHMAILEPSRFEALRVWDGGRRAGRDWLAFIDGADEDSIITAGERYSLIAIRDAVMADETAGGLVQSAPEVERSIEWTDESYGRAKARLDACGPRLLIEVKTTAAADSERRMMAQFFDLGYHLQLGWYWHGWREQTHADCNVWVLAIPSRPPYYCATIRVPESILRAGYEQAADIAQRYRICERTGIWPGPHDRVIDYSLPAWAGGSEDDMSDGEIEASEL